MNPWQGIIEASAKKRGKLAKRERAQNVKIRALKSMAYKRENAGIVYGHKPLAKPFAVKVRDGSHY